MGVLEIPKGSGVWWASWKDKNGKRHRKKVGPQGDAEKRYKTERTIAGAGLGSPFPIRGVRGITISTLIDDALLFVKKKDHHDQQSYISKAGIVRPVFGSYVAEKLTALEIENWLVKRLETPATRNRYKAFFSLCYREGMRNGKVKYNVAKAVMHFTEPEGRVRYLVTDEEAGVNEYKTLYEKIEERFPEHLAEFVVSVLTGMRHTEQFSRRWKDFHPERRIIDGYMKAHGTRKRRDVKLDQYTMDVLLAHRPAKWKPNDLMFPKPNEGTANGQERWFEKCVEEAGLADYTWHCNRHTFCSWLAIAGCDMQDIQKMAGHQSITMTQKYVHLSPKKTEIAIDKLAMFHGTAR